MALPMETLTAGGTRPGTQSRRVEHVRQVPAQHAALGGRVVLPRRAGRASGQVHVHPHIQEQGEAMHKVHVCQPRARDCIIEGAQSKMLQDDSAGLSVRTLP